MSVIGERTEKQDVNPDVGCQDYQIGGERNHAAHAVGFWGDFLVYTTAAGDTSLNRFGDYVTVRRSWPGTNSFSAEGYSTRIANASNNCPGNGTFAAAFGSSQNFCFDPHYVTFRHGP